MKFIPRTYQKKAIRFMLEHPGCGLFLDPGLGKTSVALAGFKVLKQQKAVRKALVIAPLRVCYGVWPKEAEKWDDFHGISVHVLHGKGKNLDAPADIHIINPEGLQWLFVELHRRGGRWPYELLVVDESTKFKNTRSQRFQLLKNHLGKFLRRMILTGTPTPNGLLDLFGQMFIVDNGKALGRFITHYRNQFFYPSGYMGYEWTPQKDAHERIMQRVKPVTLSMEASDWLELPERVDNDIVIDLPPDVVRQYRAFEREMILQLEQGKSLVAVNAGVVSMKCRQMANGGVYLEDGRVLEVHDAKVDALEDLIEQLQGSPLLVAYEFQHDLTRIRKRLGANVPAYMGGMNSKKALHLEAEWNAGRIPVLLAQPQAAAWGLNLQESGSTICWFGNIWDYEPYHQFNLRVLRQGQKAKRVVIHHLVAKGTVDELIREVIQGKHTDQRLVLRMLKDRLRLPKAA